MCHILRAWVSLPETQIVLYIYIQIPVLSTHRISIGVSKEMQCSVSVMQITEHNANHRT